MTQADAPNAEALYRAHQDWLFRWLCQRLGCAYDAADLTQDTYLRLIDSGRLPPTWQDGERYLVRIAKGLAVDRQRRRHLERAYREALAVLPEPVAPAPEQREAALESLVAIDRALDGLPHPQREVFLLARFEGYRHADIAALFGIAVPTVRKYIARATAACLVAMDDAATVA